MADGNRTFATRDGKLSPLARKLVKEGCEPQAGFKTLAQLLEERKALLAMLKATPCFGCGERLGESTDRTCMTCSKPRALIAECEAA
jgi:hypothetical protein